MAGEWEREEGGRQNGKWEERGDDEGLHEGRKEGSKDRLRAITVSYLFGLLDLQYGR